MLFPDEDWECVHFLAGLKSNGNIVFQGVFTIKAFIQSA
jgi:hypothetical protein